MSEQDLREGIQEIKEMVKGLVDTVARYNERLIVVEQTILKRPSQECEKVIWDITEKAIARNNEHLIARHKVTHEQWEHDKLVESGQKTKLVLNWSQIIEKIITIGIFVILYFAK